MSQIEVNKIIPQSGTTVQFGESGDTINVVGTLDGSGLTGLNASNLSTGTIPDARFPAALPAISGANLTNIPTQVSNTTTPTISLTSPVNEKSVTIGTFTSASGSTTNIFASSGVISDINNIAKTFTYTAPEIVDTNSSNEDITITLTAVSKKAGELTSLDGTLNVSVLEVQVADDDAVSIASYQSSEFFNDGFNY